MAPHQTLASLSQKYGPVVWLELGAIKTIAVQSSEAAKELFKIHDLSFADRKSNDAIKCCEMHKSIMATGTYGQHWKMLRKLYNFELFTNKRMNETASLRRKCVDNMINQVREEAQKCGSVDVAEVVFLMAFNLQCQSIFSCDINELPHDGDQMEFFKLTSSLAELSGIPNLSDFFPYLRRFDLQGIRRKMTKSIVRAFGIISAAVEQRIEYKKNGVWENGRKDFLDVLLDYEGRNGNEVHENLSRKDICAVITGDNIDMDFRGQHFQFLPFGAGRRICAGLVLGDRILHLVLASLLQSFDWALEDGVTPETLDTGERFGTALRKNVPLKAVPKPLMVL
ncbi:Cytochrome P450 [Dillenia turbinata]|uniref:Cytochrome P450 n=1 Tax=Dillenia turbinata TaxID=194707 RepID=A0AAN8WB83_9MAGN